MGRATRISGVILALVLAVPGRARAAGSAEADDGLSAFPPAATIQPDKPSVTDRLVPKSAAGFILVNGNFQSVPSAVAKSQADYGVSTVIGVSASGHPWEHWDYLGYVTASIGADAVNGASGSFSPEQITITYHPTGTVSLAGGYLRIPFSIGQATVIANSLFPTRPEPTAAFQGGADAGLLATYESPEGRVRVKGGLFDGLSLVSAVPAATTRGPVFSAYAELAPLGAMSPLEGDFKGSPFRFALTGGLVYRHGSVYRADGFQGTSLEDVRFALSLRVAFKGFYAQGEYLQDAGHGELNVRTRLSRGTYGEASYHVLVGEKIGISPLVRVGWSVQDEGFFPLHIVTAHAGLALYPRGDLAQRGGVRLVLEYLSERHIEESETAYGGLASILARF